MVKEGESMNKDKKRKENKGIYGNAIDYHFYHMNFIEYLTGFGLGFLAGAVVIMVFFKAVYPAAAVGVICGIAGVMLQRQRLLKKRRAELLDQFRDFLESLATSYGAGRNTDAAFRDSLTDLSRIYPDKAYIIQEIKLILKGLSNNRTIEAMLLDFGDRSGLEDIESFVDVFVETGRQGGNMSEIIVDVRSIINEKIETETEIGRVTSGSKNEMSIMMGIGFFILLFVNYSNIMSLSENTPVNVIIKSFVLLIYAVAYLWSRRILRIKV